MAAPSVDFQFNCSMCHAVRLDCREGRKQGGNMGGLRLAVWPSSTWNRGGSNIEQTSLCIVHWQDDHTFVVVCCIILITCICNVTDIWIKALFIDKWFLCLTKVFRWQIKCHLFLIICKCISNQASACTNTFDCHFFVNGLPTSLLKMPFLQRISSVGGEVENPVTEHVNIKYIMYFHVSALECGYILAKWMCSQKKIRIGCFLSSAKTKSLFRFEEIF